MTMAGLLVFALAGYGVGSCAPVSRGVGGAGRGGFWPSLRRCSCPGRQVETLERLALGANLWFGLLLPILLAVWIKLHKRG